MPGPGLDRAGDAEPAEAADAIRSSRLGRHERSGAPRAIRAGRGWQTASRSGTACPAHIS